LSRRSWTKAGNTRKVFGNSFVYFAWFAVNLTRNAGEMSGDKKIKFCRQMFDYSVDCKMSAG
jgi:hypothetical protein